MSKDEGKPYRIYRSILISESDDDPLPTASLLRKLGVMERTAKKPKNIFDSWTLIRDEIQRIIASLLMPQLMSGPTSQ